ncbi:NAD(P)H-hydrate epimerase [Harenicola maris]|uniref:NAD(P)H-hydrate epimerase n=1 Tax=Harenicola maris TaxID=2841044 RepID=UPI002E19FBD1
MLTSKDMRALERAAMDAGRVSGAQLMERAGQGAVAAILAHWPELQGAPQRAVVLCGPGNNGGDGFVIARLLHGLGWQVEVFFYGVAERLPPDARANYEAWLELGAVRVLGFPKVSPEDVADFEAAAYGMSGTGLIVDALFGIGLSRGIEGLSALFGYNDIEVGVGKRLTPARHVAIDVPSGLMSDAPEVPGYLGCFLADLTVTFHSYKPVHLDPSVARLCGEVVIVDIGL